MSDINSKSKNTKHLYRIIWPPQEETQHAELHILFNRLFHDAHTSIEYAKMIRRRRFLNDVERIKIGDNWYTIIRRSKIDITKDRLFK